MYIYVYMYVSQRFLLTLPSGYVRSLLQGGRSVFLRVRDAPNSHVSRDCGDCFTAALMGTLVGAAALCWEETSVRILQLDRTLL